MTKENKVVNGGIKGALLGALLGALIAIGIPVGALIFTTATYSGGGANIGVGLLFLALPISLPLAAWLGWKIGKKLAR